MLSEKEKAHFQKLVKKYLDGTASPQEKDFVESYYQYLDKTDPAIAKTSETDRGF